MPPSTLRIVSPLEPPRFPPFYLSFESFASLDRIIFMIELSGSRFRGLESVRQRSRLFPLRLLRRRHQRRRVIPSASSRLATIRISRWTVNDVCCFLSEFGLSPNCEHLFRDNSITGRRLLEIANEDKDNAFSILTEEIGVREALVDALLPEIQSLQHSDYFDLITSRIRSKLGCLQLTRDLSVSLSQCLGSASFIHHDFLSSVDPFALWYDMNEDLRQSVANRLAIEEEEGESEERSFRTVFDGSLFGQIEELVACNPSLNRLNPLERIRLTRVKVHIILTEVQSSFSAFSLSSLSVPTIGRIQLDSEFTGRIKTGILVGPWYLEFDERGLVIPRRLEVGARSAVFDVGEGSSSGFLVEKSRLSSLQHTVAELIAEWNGCVEYVEEDPSAVTQCGNCQTFVDSVLVSLGFSTRLGESSGALGKFLERVRRDGSSEFQFDPCEEFRMFFGLDRDEIYRFQTHRQLDDFATKIRMDCLDVGTVFGSEWSLMRSYDRILWDRHLLNEEEERFKPREIRIRNDDDVGCPFGVARCFGGAIC